MITAALRVIQVQSTAVKNLPHKQPHTDRAATENAVPVHALTKRLKRLMLRFGTNINTETENRTFQF